MSSETGHAESLNSWMARDWDHLREVWDRLIPEDNSPTVLEGRNLTPQESGILFERLVMEAFRLEGHDVHGPFPIQGRESGRILEQIDGLIISGWQGFLVESKFWKDPVDVGPIFTLHARVASRPVGTIGLFFSASDYTDSATESAEYLRPVQVLLFDSSDLEWGFARPGRMMAMVRRKWALALKHGKPHLPTAQIDEAGNLRVTPLGLHGKEFDHDQT